VNRRAVLAAAILPMIAAFLLSRTTHSSFAGHRNTDASIPLPTSDRVSMPADPPAAATLTGASLETPIAPDRAGSPRETTHPAPSREAETPTAPDPQTAAVTDIDPHEALGSKNAPIVMEVFSDFQCPACKTLFTTTNRQLMDNYVSTGKVYLIHRDFPLPMHAHSKVAAQYSRAAAQIGKLEAVEEVLFQNQEVWEQSGDVDGTVAKVLSPAEMTKVRALVKAGTLDAAITKDQALGNGYKVNQTPTTIIHAKGQTFPVVGVVSYDVLHQFLDQLLGQ
jgi:protein-disulfide isomerase